MAGSVGSGHVSSWPQTDVLKSSPDIRSWAQCHIASPSRSSRRHLDTQQAINDAMSAFEAKADMH